MHVTHSSLPHLRVTLKATQKAISDGIQPFEVQAMKNTDACMRHSLLCSKQKSQYLDISCRSHYLREFFSSATAASRDATAAEERAKSKGDSCMSFNLHHFFFLIMKNQNEPKPLVFHKAVPGMHSQKSSFSVMRSTE